MGEGVRCSVRGNLSLLTAQYSAVGYKDKIIFKNSEILGNNGGLKQLSLFNPKQGSSLSSPLNHVHFLTVYPRCDIIYIPVKFIF